MRALHPLVALLTALQIATLSFSVSANTDSAQYEKGQTLSQYCMGCHGETGIANIESNPNLAGQNKPYLVYALKAYRDGIRKGGMASIMRPNASGLSDDDIDALATYFAAQSGKQTTSQSSNN
ncbi:cytochrome c [Alteromonas sp. DY56-G5]|jgi:cytochrome c553|uniref:Cytochrome c-552 domain protein n=3 Tax=root TaxID=1 RepID=A0A1E7D8S5_ALTMA|nr:MULTISPECIES: cytochrome c [Alteromonas]MCG8498078.1 cytochrome c [Enterobacterales bacterium]MEC8298748.1 cytochrome c [Pseudomonadota bacterium]AFS39121.1 cytochrome [Alteromonas macleodii ATCC 27126]AFT76334.1 cytochrome [Alteromonas macleodii str. 'English Channel 673']MBL3810543.1 cytochrome c [Alteromonas macleodii]|tara:strand:- start:2767 stop:3135 length:369 start_codon:yes stop_codon:yes gene_type:complete